MPSRDPTVAILLRLSREKENLRHKCAEPRPSLQPGFRARVSAALLNASDGHYRFYGAVTLERRRRSVDPTAASPPHDGQRPHAIAGRPATKESLMILRDIAACGDANAVVVITGV